MKNGIITSLLAAGILLSANQAEAQTKGKNKKNTSDDKNKITIVEQPKLSFEDSLSKVLLKDTVLVFDKDAPILKDVQNDLAVEYYKENVDDDVATLANTPVSNKADVNQAFQQTINETYNSDTENVNINDIYDNTDATIKKTSTMLNNGVPVSNGKKTKNVSIKKNFRTDVQNNLNALKTADDEATDMINKTKDKSRLYTREGKANSPEIDTLGSEIRVVLDTLKAQEKTLENIINQKQQLQKNLNDTIQLKAQAQGEYDKAKKTREVLMNLSNKLGGQLPKEELAKIEESEMIMTNKNQEIARFDIAIENITKQLNEVDGQQKNAESKRDATLTKFGTLNTKYWAAVAAQFAKWQAEQEKQLKGEVTQYQSKNTGLQTSKKTLTAEIQALGQDIQKMMQADTTALSEINQDLTDKQKERSEKVELLNQVFYGLQKNDVKMILKLLNTYYNQESVVTQSQKKLKEEIANMNKNMLFNKSKQQEYNGKIKATEDQIENIKNSSAKDDPKQAKKMALLERDLIPLQAQLEAVTKKIQADSIILAQRNIELTNLSDLHDLIGDYLAIGNYFKEADIIFHDVERLETAIDNDSVKLSAYIMSKKDIQKLLDDNSKQIDTLIKKIDAITANDVSSRDAKASLRDEQVTLGITASVLKETLVMIEKEIEAINKTLLENHKALIYKKTLLVNRAASLRGALIMVNKAREELSKKGNMVYDMKNLGDPELTLSVIPTYQEIKNYKKK